MDKLKNHIDIVGMLTSGICAIHCLFLPLLISYGLIDGFFSSAMHNLTELFIVIGSIAIAFYSIHKGIKGHRVNTPYWFFGIGLATLLIAFAIGSHLFMSAGGILIAIAHILNYRLLHRKPSIY